MTAVHNPSPAEPEEVPAGMDWISPEALDSKLKALAWSQGDLARACTPPLSANALTDLRRRGGLLKRSTLDRIARALEIREEERERLTRIRDELRGRRG